MAAVSVAKGTTLITENVFESRYSHAKELNKMGTNIFIRSHVAVVQGVDNIYGADVQASDLRAGAALVAAGLYAEGETRIGNIDHIKRGYEGLVTKLSSLGADIYEYEKQR
jgi:UDP-N-acetylglucosamine 1-carboxyvinyltransferase